MVDENVKLTEAAEDRSATIEIAKRYGGLENLGEKLMKTENFEMALDEVV